MRSKEILVVDDDVVALKILESVLNGAGYSVVPVANGRRAIEAAKERPPDLVILDIMMPDMDGGDVAHVLKNEPKTKDIPIMFLSSLVTDKEEQSCSKKHGICFVSKPFNRDDLLNKIKEYI